MNGTKGIKGFVKEPLHKRFWRKVNKNGPIHPLLKTKCWLWTGHTQNRGYGTLWVNEDGKKKLAHRIAWFLATGKWPPKLVLHKCDVPACVRHSHHFEGSAVDNGKDSVAKGRNGYGKEASEAQRRKTHCPKHHRYTKANTIITKAGGRLCHTCNKERCKAYYKSRHN